jgi:hypothetical protein
MAMVHALKSQANTTEDANLIDLICQSDLDRESSTCCAGWTRRARSGRCFVCKRSNGGYPWRGILLRAADTP